MKRLTVILTIIAVICTAIAWIPYVSAHDYTGDHVAESAPSDLNTSHSEKESDCDHCCHFGAHVVGLMATINASTVSVTQADRANNNLRPPSYESFPPGPPPRHHA